MREKVGENQKVVKDTIQAITGEEAKVIAVPTELIHYIGSLTKRGKTQKALFLSQLIYWSDKGVRPDRFIFKTQNEWKEETGLSKTQVAEYTDEFEKLGLLETMLKKANGSPTVHYKLKLDIFLESFSKFLQNRIFNNRKNQTKESEDSLTENTTQITFKENSLSNYLSSDINEKVINQFRDISYADTSSFHGETGSNHNDAGGSSADKVLIPSDFEPTWDAKYQAIRKYPRKSIALATKSFITKKSDGKTKMTIEQWHQAWEGWISREWETLGNDNLLKEHSEILEIVLNDVYKASFNCFQHLFQVWEISSNLISNYSEFTITDAIKTLFEENYFGRVGEYYFAWADIKNSEEMTIELQQQIVELELADEPIELYSELPDVASLNELKARRQKADSN